MTRTGLIAGAALAVFGVLPASAQLGLGGNGGGQLQVPGAGIGGQGSGNITVDPRDTVNAGRDAAGQIRSTGKATKDAAKAKAAEATAAAKAAAPDVQASGSASASGGASASPDGANVSGSASGGASATVQPQ